MKLLLDEMLPPAIAEQLRLRGHDVEGVARNRGLRGQPDQVIFTFAQTEGGTIVTENVRDYRELALAELQAGRSHAGVIFIQWRMLPRNSPRSIGRVVGVLDLLLSSDVSLVDREYWLS